MSRPSRRRGSVIIVVLVLIALASLLLGRFMEDNSLELSMASREADRRRLRADAQSELELALAVIAEILAALQRIGRHPPPALMVSPDDALQSVRTAMMLGAVLPDMRVKAEALASDLADLVRIITPKVQAFEPGGEVASRRFQELPFSQAIPRWPGGVGARSSRASRTRGADWRSTPGRIPRRSRSRATPASRCRSRSLGSTC